MAIFTTDLKGELEQIKKAANDVVNNSVNPMINDAIKQASGEINKVVEKASSQIQENIKLLSEEIHNQRKLTKDELKDLIEHAASSIGTMIDDRLAKAKSEANSFVVERITHLKSELEDASIKSRRALYANLAISIASALAMAAIGIVYKRISVGELDIFTTFRVFLLSAATGTAVFSATKFIQNWLSLNKEKKNAATILVNHLSLLRPNGAIGLFILSIVLVAAWYLASFYTAQ
jgi:gas vesicle protein